MALDEGLLGHWRLAGDCSDGSGRGNHGRNEGADLGASGPDGQPGGAASFDGRQSMIVVPHHESLRLGTADFSLAVWLHTDAPQWGSLGDILSKYDPVARRGLNFGLMSYTGAASNQSNTRNVHFGIDAGTSTTDGGTGRDDRHWIDCGRPGNAVMIKALAVFAGDLYAGTYEAGADEAGHVYRYLGGSEWEDCGAPDRCNTVASLAVHAGALYAGVSHYRASGSALPDSANTHPGGRVYRYAGDQQWVSCGKLDDGDVLARAGAVERPSARRSPVCDTVACLTAYGDHLYAIPLYSEGLFRYEGGTTWTACGTPGRRLFSLCAFQGGLYGAGNEGGGVFRYEGGDAWSTCGFQEGVTQLYSFAAYRGQLYAGSWPAGGVFRWQPEGAGNVDAGGKWLDCGRLGSEQEVMGLAVYNGKLYGGTLPLAEVYRYDGEEVDRALAASHIEPAGGAGRDSGRKWTRTGRLDWTPEVRYRRAWSMAVFRGRLYCGTLPSGRVYALEAGQNVTFDREISPGWRHLAAVRCSGRLLLFVDGCLVSTSNGFDPSHFDLTNDRPLVLGFGQHDHLQGCLSDVRLYRRALAEAEVTALAATGAHD
jgi:hypothetical protein